MSVVCQLCQKSFSKLISSTHLKFTHQISSQEYKTQFGADSLASREYRAEKSAANSGSNNRMFGRTHSQESKQTMSQKLKGRVPSNKGKKVEDPDQLGNLRQAIALRENRYKISGYHPRKGKSLSDESKQKISQAVKSYTENNPDEVKSRAKKAKETLIAKGYDFGSHMRGKHHSQETKNRIKTASQQIGQYKKQISLSKLQQAIIDANLICETILDTTVELKCKKCDNQFSMTKQYFNPSKWRIDICPICRPQKVKSDAELEILHYVRMILLEQQVLSGNRSEISPLELDIYIPHLKIGIEYCGLYWHSELQGKDKLYHRKKYLLCQQKGIRLVTIFEDEWLQYPELVKHRIAHILGQQSTRIYARKCVIKEIDSHTAREFCDQNHIQGYGSAKIKLGLFFNQQLIQVATFAQPNISKGTKNNQDNEWELSRLCSLSTIHVTGGASKLFQYFVKTYNPSRVISYCDLRWNTGKVYQQLGFDKTKDGTPNYWYFQMPNVKRLHRFGLRKNQTDDPSLTEWENRKNQGWNRIWDCGHSKWTWVNKKAGQ